MKIAISHLVCAATLVAMTTTATADDLRDRTIGHVITAPTAWLPSGLVLNTGLDQRGTTYSAAALAIGPFASVELSGDSDVRVCRGCEGRAEPRWLGRATFKLASRQDRWFRGAPALAFGVRSTFRGNHDTRASDAFVVASYDLGPVRLHAGGAITDADDDQSMGQDGLGDQVRHGLRPLGGFEWTPAQYPKTSLMGDVMWTSQLESPEAARPSVLRYTAGLAVRYQAFTWGSIELGMRVREKEEIGDLAFFTRVNLSTR